MANDVTNGAPKRDEDDVVIVNYFVRNHPEEELERYRGNWVAWSKDGRKVLVADPDPYKLCEKIDAAGLTPDDYVLSGIEVDW